MRPWQWLALAAAVLAAWWYVMRQSASASAPTSAGNSAAAGDDAAPSTPLPTFAAPATYNRPGSIADPFGAAPTKTLDVSSASGTTLKVGTSTFVDTGINSLITALNRSLAVKPAPTEVTENPNYPPTAANPATSFATGARKSGFGGLL